MKKKTGRVAATPIEFDYEQFLDDVKNPATDLWIKYLLLDPRMLADFQRFLNLMIGRAQAHAMNLKGPEAADDLLRLQGGVRVLATMREFSVSILKQSIENSSGRVGSQSHGTGGSDAGRSSQDARGNSG